MGKQKYKHRGQLVTWGHCGLMPIALRAQGKLSVSSKCAKSTGGGEVNAQHTFLPPAGAWGLTYLDRPWQLPGGTFWCEPRGLERRLSSAVSSWTVTSEPVQEAGHELLASWDAKVHLQAGAPEWSVSSASSQSPLTLKQLTYRST